MKKIVYNFVRMTPKYYRYARRYRRYVTQRLASETRLKPLIPVAVHVYESGRKNSSAGSENRESR